MRAFVAGISHSAACGDPGKYAPATVRGGVWMQVISIIKIRKNGISDPVYKGDRFSHDARSAAAFSGTKSPAADGVQSRKIVKFPIDITIYWRGGSE